MRTRQNLLLLLLLAITMNSYGQASFTGEYTNNFNTYAGTLATLPVGWTFAGTPSVEKGYGTGTLNTGGIYSFGSAADGSLGYLHSGSATPTGSYTGTFVNNTGAVITSLFIAYNFEQWRGGGSNTTGFPTVTVNGVGVAALGGSGTATSPSGTCVTSPKSATVSVSIAIGATFTIKWQSDDQSGSENGISIDDFKMCVPGKAFTVTPGSNSPVTAPSPIIFSGAASGTAPYSAWSWTGPLSYTNGTQNPTITPSDVSNAGTYTLVVTDALGCTGTGTTAVVVNPGGSGCSGTPAAGSTSAIPSRACGTGASTVAFSGGTASADITYQWYSSATGVAGSYSPISSATSAIYNPTGISATTYYQMVSTCPASVTSNTSTATVFTVDPLPAISATPSGGNICSGGPGLSMTASGAASYTWAPATGLSATAGATVTANPTSNMIYTITGTSAASCVGTGTVAVTYDLAPSALTITPATASACVGSAPLALTATGGIVGPTTVNSGVVTIPGVIGGTSTISSAVLMAGVPAGAVITGATVNIINFGVTWQHDYVINIKAPNNNVLNLINQEGNVTSAAVSFTNTSINSAGGSAFPSGSEPFTGTWAADAVVGMGAAPFTSNVPAWGSLFSIPNGAWTLSVYNVTTFPNTLSGTIQWSITLTYSYQAPTTWSPITDLYSDASATTPITASTALNTVYVRPVTAGTPTYTATALNGGCSSTANRTVSMNALPATIGGTPSVCVGGTTALTNATTGGAWSASNASATVGTDGVVTGASATISAGIDTIYYTVPSGCNTSVVITVNPLPAAITGTPTVCPGGNTSLASGPAGGTWSVSNATATVGTSGVVTGVAIAGGIDTVSYTLATGCATSLTVSVNAAPTVYNMTGGGHYCATGTGVPMGLDNSATGINYQLFRDASSVGSFLPGTGSALDFGSQSVAGNYSVVATNATTGCTSITASIIVTIDPLPTAANVTGGGHYCAGGAGVAIGLDNSATGINYQLYNGATLVGSAVPGTGSGISFGTQTATGTYTVLATNATTLCTSNMTGSATITIDALPVAYNVTGTGHYCAGGTGVAIGLDNSATGINYQLYNGAATVGSAVPGTGTGISFGTQTAIGTYTVVGSDGTSACTANMTGSATISIDPLPTAYNVTGTGHYCSGGTGLAIGLDNSATGINYQLYNGAATVGSAVPGTGSGISFGLQTAAGTYTVVATDGTSLCTANMTGSAVITIDPLPTAANVTGGGHYCAGGIGLAIGLDNSTTGINYQLYNGATLVGSAVPGTGSGISFGTQTATGTYTVVATDAATLCTSNMTGSATITIDALPLAHTVTGSGAFCAGGTGVTIGLDGSETGINYQLYQGSTTVGTAVPGTGSAISFGPQTAAGTYTVLATSGSSACTLGMTGSATVTVNPLPIAHNVTGGGAYCAGGTSFHIGLDNSATGINYQLYNGATAVGSAMPGTGAALDFGIQATAGTYTVRATDATTTCTNAMTGSATITVNALPLPHTVTGGGAYCAGGTGVSVGLNGSDLGVNYQLYNGATLVGSAVPGTGAAISFGTQTTSGTYTVVATNATTTCTRNMTGSVTVTINPLPTAFAMTGGGSLCAGAAGITIGLINSQTGINYQLYNGVATVGAAIPGTGSGISFGAITAAGTYTVLASNPLTGCQNAMTGSAAVTVNPLPTAFTVTGGGGYCAGGTGVTIGLSNSTTGVNYQLYNGATTIGSAMPGTTGTGISFGTFTATGTYSVLATNATTTCTRAMTGSVTVTINPLPTPANVTGGGHYCAGGTGVTLGLDGSAVGINYQLYNGATPSGAPVAGTGSGISFGTRTAAGTYTVLATNATTGCTRAMLGNAVITIDPLPTAFTVTGGGNYCAGGTGVSVGLLNSATGIDYQLYNGATAVGSVMPGTGAALDFGLQTAAGTYTVLATNTTTGCTQTMTGSATVNIDPILAPSVTIATGTTGTICDGTSITFTATPVNGGATPTYSWTVNGSPAGVTGNTYVYTPSNGDIIDVTLNSSYACAVPATATSSMTITITPSVMPSLTIAALPGNPSCEGTEVTFSATPVNGGPAPSFVWTRNSINVATGPNYLYTPADGDQVYCMVRTSLECVLADSVYSSTITMTVVPTPAAPVVTITAAPSLTINAGQSVTLTATTTGASPAYQWVINGMPVAGATNATYTSSSFANRDSISCEVIVGTQCQVTGHNWVRMNVWPAGVQGVNVQGAFSLFPNPAKGSFTIKGSLGSVTDQEVSLELTDMLGQVVYTNKVISKGGNIEELIAPAKTLANGVYLLTLSTSAEHQVFHVVMEQ